jgi:hypothetical protein
MRQDYRINTKLTTMFGMHLEEMLARLANYDLPIYFMELDAMSMFVLMILKHHAPGRKVKYFRMCAGSGRFRTFILVAQYTVTIADDQGRIVQVCCIHSYLPCSLRLNSLAKSPWDGARPEPTTAPAMFTPPSFVPHPYAVQIAFPHRLFPSAA